MYLCVCLSVCMYCKLIWAVSLLWTSGLQCKCHPSDARWWNLVFLIILKKFWAQKLSLWPTETCRPDLFWFLEAKLRKTGNMSLKKPQLISNDLRQVFLSSSLWFLIIFFSAWYAYHFVLSEFEDNTYNLVSLTGRFIAMMKADSYDQRDPGGHKTTEKWVTDPIFLWAGFAKLQCQQVINRMGGHDLVTGLHAQGWVLLILYSVLLFFIVW